MSQIDFLLTDPRPDIKFDSHRWKKLFKLIMFKVSDSEKSYLLLRRMWTIRSAGATLKRELSGIKLAPLLDPDGDWPDMEFYEYIREKYLAPYAKELTYLMRLVEEQTN